MFKRIRVKRGGNIGLELFEHAKSVYISKVANDGIGLKRGMRIIAINDHPCPDSVREAITLLSLRTYNDDDDDDGYVTFVTGEEWDFANSPSVVGADDCTTASTTTSGGGDNNDNDNHDYDSYSIRSSTGYV
ncbi:MAG: hypothetical protein SGBAC_013381 [Bacillariaceae sp.]